MGREKNPGHPNPEVQANEPLLKLQQEIATEGKIGIELPDPIKEGDVLEAFANISPEFAKSEDNFGNIVLYSNKLGILRFIYATPDPHSKHKKNLHWQNSGKTIDVMICYDGRKNGKTTLFSISEHEPTSNKQREYYDEEKIKNRLARTSANRETMRSVRASYLPPTSPFRGEANNLQEKNELQKQLARENKKDKFTFSIPEDIKIYDNLDLSPDKSDKFHALRPKDSAAMKHLLDLNPKNLKDMLLYSAQLGVCKFEKVYRLPEMKVGGNFHLPHQLQWSTKDKNLKLITSLEPTTNDLTIIGVIRETAAPEQENLGSEEPAKDEIPATEQLKQMKEEIEKAKKTPVEFPENLNEKDGLKGFDIAIRTTNPRKIALYSIATGILNYGSEYPVGRHIIYEYSNLRPLGDELGMYGPLIKIEVGGDSGTATIEYIKTKKEAEKDIAEAKKELDAEKNQGK